MNEVAAPNSSNGQREDPRPDPGYRWRPVVYHALLAVPAIAAVLAGVGPQWVMALSGLAVCMGYPALLAMESRRSPLLVGPMTFWVAWYFVGLGLSALWVALRIAGGAENMSFSAASVPPQDVATGHVVFWVGAILYHAGNTLVRPLPRVDADHTGSATQRNDRIGVGLFILWAVSVGVRLIPDAGAVIGAAGGVLARASLAALCAYAIAGRVAARPGRYWIVLAVGTGVEFLLGLDSGSKAVAMYAFVPVLWTTLLGKRRIPRLAALGAGIVILYFGFVMPVIMESRKRDAGTASNRERIIAVLTEGLTESVEFDQLEQLLERQFDSIPVGYLVGKVREDGLRNGETMTYVEYAFIPRLLWPEKPTVTRGAWFDYEVRGEETRTSLAQTAHGELYWNFGLAGVVVGMFLLGLFNGALWRFAGSSPVGDPFRMCLYVIITLGTVDMSEAGSVFIGQVFSFLFFSALVWLSGRALKRRMRRRAGHLAGAQRLGG